MSIFVKMLCIFTKKHRIEEENKREKEEESKDENQNENQEEKKRYIISGENNKIVVLENGVERVLGETDTIDGLDIKISGSDNKIYISDLENFYNTSIYVNTSNNVIRFGEKFSNMKSINNVVIIVKNGNNQILEIGDHTLIWGANIVMDEQNSGLHIGNDCLLSSEITIWTADGHPILDMETNERINKVSRPVYIGDKVWIGQGVRITKNASIPNGCIIGGGAVVCKQFDLENSIIAGNPAKIIKTNVYWKHG